MEADELNAPLGQTRKSKAPKLPVAAPQVLAGVLGLSGLVVVAWAVLVHDPLGGEPVAVVATKAPDDAPAVAGGAGKDGKEHSRHDGERGKATDAAVAAAAAKAAAPPPGSKTITIIDGSSGKSKDVVIPGGDLSGDPVRGPSGKLNDRQSNREPAPVDRRFLEVTRHGAVPKIGPGGVRVSALFAHPRPLPANRKDSPRIAIVVGGVGISASGTAEAFSALPEPVTFALAPYSTDVARLAERARAENHEVLLQVPMEPFDYPDNDPGPQTLLSGLTPEQNVDRLHWLMSRFHGYVGVVSFMGARFTATEQALTPVIQEVAKRGLIFVDGGASTRSVAAQIAGSQNLPFARTNIVLDAVPTPIEIDRALARLEMAAREDGAAVGLATAAPGAIARIAEWAKNVESRGFVLVPISMVAAKAKSS